MIVGEQPGDQEDMAGRPFVGPAGQLLDSAMSDAGIERHRSYLTNAVKRFKFVSRGKRRIHQTPNAGEIAYYRWWLNEERKIVRPKIIIALGATAMRALTGKSLKIAQYRGSPHMFDDGATFLVTVHPSFLLRFPDENGRRIEYRKFVGDLKMARRLV
jgi:DNA polymerase